MKTTILGVDTETRQGPPITFQFWGRDPELCSILFVGDRKPSAVFCDYLNTLPKNGTNYLLWGHNLKFDLLSLLYDQAEKLREERFEFDLHDWRFEGVYSGLVFCRMKRERHYSVVLLDTFSYFKDSLEGLAKIFCPEVPKLPKPDGLGDKSFTETDLEFVAYAMRDAEIACKIGERICALHEENDIPQSVSIADMAAKIFRRTYLKKSWPWPGQGVTGAGFQAYHGGKNLITVPAGVYENVTFLDIVSAYPHAMSEAPGLSDWAGYKCATFAGHPPGLPSPWGVYKISGFADNCKYPSLFCDTPQGFVPLRGTFRNVWVTGHELAEAMRMKEVRLSEVFGYYYETKRDDPKPLKEYVEHFFELKARETDPVKRLTWKLLLNSLSGKLIQTIRENVPVSVLEDNTIVTKTRTAGGLFHPFLAALITGHTRARIHALEHKYKALHTSTDGIMTQMDPDPADLSPALGGVKVECRGRVLLLRNKLYVVFDPETNEVIKYALHGFRGSVDDLLKLYDSGIAEYEYVRCNTLREALRRRRVPNRFDTFRATLDLPTGWGPNRPALGMTAVAAAVRKELAREPLYQAEAVLRRSLGPGYKAIADRAHERDVLDPKHRKVFHACAAKFHLGDGEDLVRLISTSPTLAQAVHAEASRRAPGDQPFLSGLISEGVLP